MVERRDILRFAFGLGVGGSSMRPTPAASQLRDWFRDPIPFSSDRVTTMARDLAKKPYAAPSSDMPAPFAKLSSEQYAEIRLKPEGMIWNPDETGFSIEPLTRGFAYTTPMELSVVEDGFAHRLVFDSRLYDFGKLKPKGPVADLGFSGFRVMQRGDGKSMMEVAQFQGATFFRALGRGMVEGVMARGLAIRTGDAKGEELPIFRAMYIETPTLAAGTLVAHALLDSPSLTGCYSFTLHPGESAILDTELTLFARTAIDHFGLAPMQGTYFLGPLDKERPDDVRPSVYETTGLQLANGNGEWLWRPVSNRETLQASAFGGVDPRGFGLLQRTRSFDLFQDDLQHWERRPSLWIQPIENWGEGTIELLEIPTRSENNDNIIASWHPKAPLQPGKEAYFAYRQFWCWWPPARPPLSEVRLSRNGTGSRDGRRRFIVEFVGDVLGDDKRSANVKPTLTIKPGSIVSLRAFLSRPTKSCRVLFEIDTGGEAWNELRLVLESDGTQISETWLFRWTS